MKRYYFGTNPLGPSRKVKAAIRKAAKAINAPCDETRARLERLFFSKYGVDKESILFSNSLKELLFVICRRLRPRKILIVGPALGIYQEAALASSAVIKNVSGSEESFFFPDLKELVEKAEGCDLIFFANPNRVSGKAISVTVLNQMLAALSLKNCVTVIDESLMDFAEGEGCIRSAVGSSHLIVLRTTAYYFGLPGLELACAVAIPKVIESLRPGLLSHPGIPAMEAARTALKDKSYSRSTEQFMKEEKKLLRKAIGTLPGMVIYDSDTNIFLLKAADPAEEIACKAERAGLAVERCSGIDGLNDTFLRISVMKHDHNLKLIKLLKGMSAESEGKKIGGDQSL
ncbi:MAG: aminotransferase class I/II-fold pyridoxal phosphate-dependent enzyme [Nitrospirae bacterium]|nr:aminotransferase class I/II-fold pyridoxal phosphate-dependent enzyme [Nitrospirota bacterium]